jgi:hypothetical protein
MITPDYLGAIRRGEIICNPLEISTIETTYDPPTALYLKYSDSNSSKKIYCAEHSTWHNRINVTAGVWAHYPVTYLETLVGGVLPSDMRQSVIDRAVVQAHANVDTSEMMALATLAEGRKSVESVSAILRRAYRIFRNVRKLNLRAVAKELSPKELADRYMEARYAIRPLIYDVNGITRSLEKARGFARRTFRGYASDSHSNSDTIIGSQAPVSDDWVRNYSVEYTARAGVLCDVSISDISVLGLDQIAETAWELVPFSFIADWFANTGDWIAAHTPNAGVTQRASWVTVRRKTTKSCTVTGSRWNLGVNQTGITLTRAKPTHKVEETFLERLVSPAISTWPSANLRLDGYKLTDLGIILRKVFS